MAGKGSKATQFKKGDDPRRGAGGARAGSGQKPKEAIESAREKLKKYGPEAMDLLYAIAMGHRSKLKLKKDETIPIEQRRLAATELVNHWKGKAKQEFDHTLNVGDTAALDLVNKSLTGAMNEHAEASLNGDGRRNH